MNLETSVRFVQGVGPTMQKRLSALGITTVRDLLFHFPREYEDWSVITPIEKTKEGNSYCVCGTVKEITQHRTFKKRFSLTTAVVEDSTGALKIVWFNQPYLTETLPIGQQACFAGKITRDKYGVAMSNPSYEKISSQLSGATPPDLTHMGRLTPVYPETAGVSSKLLRFIIKAAIESLDSSHKDTDIIPESIAQAKGFPPFAKAIQQAHFPNTLKEAEFAKHRFAFEELLLISLFILSERKKIASVKAPAVPFSAELMQKFTSRLPFQLTSAQKKSAWHILKDLEKPRPMNRLLQGDVGSGKTVVATMAALSVIKAGYQAAFLSPTEILAKQHFKTVSELLRPFKLDIGLLTGKADRFISKKLPNEVIEISREKLLKKALAGEIPILIGTHALIQETVRFGKLGLVIVDEQHRFGVQQRAKLLRGSALIPHLLSMTATPIPRTLAMTIYGDLDLSVIDELPKGRKPIITKIVPQEKRKEAYAFIGQEVKKGRQVFVICPRIEPKDANAQFGGTRGKWSEAKAVKEEYEKLAKQVFPDLRLAMLHGKMASRDKEEAMKTFKRGKTDILVSTSVVEVGVDIPNASVMVIDGADYFGLAQLHQFRGRVGRAEHQSYCFLFAAESSSRLRALEKTESGFKLAEMDLKLRGPGDFAGVKQWGMPDFAMAQLSNSELVAEAREAAHTLLEKDLTLKKYPLMKTKLSELRERLHLE